MAVREFNGSSDDLRFAKGGWSATGALTIAVLVKRTANATWDSLVAAHTSGNVGTCGFELTDASGGNFNNRLSYFAGGSGDAANNANQALVAADGWAIAVVRKAAGTTIPDFHLFKLGTATWATAPAGTSAPNAASSAGGDIRIGSYESVDWAAMRLALAAVWDSQLSQVQVEALATGLTTAAWTGHAVAPKAVWEFNQAVVTTDVVDLVGTSTQSVRDGTSVVTGDDPPGWTFSGGGGTTDKPTTDTGTLTSSSSLAASISVTDSIALTDASSTVDNAVSTADTITLTESSVSNTNKVASDTISFLEPDVWEDSITSAVDGATLTESPSALEIGKFTTDSISFGDSGTINKDVNVGETFTVIDASEIFVRDAVDAFTFSESSAASNVNTRSDSVSLSESSSATAAASPSDSASFTESASVSVLVDTGDTLSLIELTGVNAAAPTTDSLSLTESATRADLANPDKISSESLTLIEALTVDSDIPALDSIGFTESSDIVVGILAQDDISLTEIADSNNLIDLVDDFTLTEEVTVDALLDAIDSAALVEEVLVEADIQALDDLGIGFSESADQPAIAIDATDDFFVTDESGLQSNELATGDSFTLDDSAVANRLLVASDSISLSESALALNPESVTQELIVNVSVIPRLYKLKKKRRRHKNSRLRG